MWEIEDLGNEKYMLKFGDMGLVFPIAYCDLKIIVDKHNEDIFRLISEKDNVIQKLLSNE